MEFNDAVVNWVNTFELSLKCQHLTELFDGIIISKILNEISPSHFTLESLNINTNDNLILCVNNIRSILNMLQDYYENYLEKYIDIKSISVESITNHKDCDEILNLVELVVGVAVMSDAKAIFIEKIFGLDIDTQNVLKNLIQQVMIKSSINPNDNKSLSDEERISEDFRSNEMVLHLQTEIQRLENIVIELERKNNILQEDAILLKETISNQEADNANLMDNANRSVDSSITIKNLQQELDEVTRELDIQQVQNEKYESEKIDNLKKIESMREMQNRLEADVRHLQDEVDVSRENKIKLDKAEKKADKFQQRLEELTALKKQNIEVTEKMDTYLDKIHELENSSIGNDKTLKKMIDHYKDKNIELETEKFELISKNELLNHNLSLIKNDYDQVIDVRKRLEDEIKLLQLKIEQYEEGVDLNFKKTNSIESMNGEDVDKDMKIIMLLTEVESLQKAKKDREESLLSTKKQLLEANRLLEANNNPINSNNSNNRNQENSSISLSSYKDLEQKLSLTSNTLKLLEERLKEKEGVINILEQDNSKLEIYSRRTLETFKEKYTDILQNMKIEKKLIDQKLATMNVSFEKKLETSKKEERILISSMYELGSKIIDKSIQSNVLVTTNKQNTFLGIQRYDLIKRKNDIDIRSTSSSQSQYLTPNSNNNSNVNSPTLSDYGTPIRGGNTPMRDR